MKIPKILSEKIRFKAKYFDVVTSKIKLPNGRIAEWDSTVWNHNSVSIVAVDDKNNIYLSREWRTPWNKKITIIPAGSVKKNSREEENIKQARNELREEIGLDAKKIEKLATMLLATKIRNKMHIYLATGLFKSPKKAEPDEVIEIVKMPFKKAYKMFLTGEEETTGYTILGMNLAKEKLKL